MKVFFDYFLICLVGFVAGGWMLIGTGYFGSSAFDLFASQAAHHEQSPASAETSNDGPSFSALDEKIVEPTKPLEQRKRDAGKTRAWLDDGAVFVDEIKYIQEANCSDHAMRQYAQFLRRFDTSGFDQKTGRIISGEGTVTTRFQWSVIYRSQLFMLHPLEFMKDELVPKNFRHVMRAIPRKENWKNCSFKIPIIAMFGTL